MTKQSTKGGALAGKTVAFVGNLGYRDTLRDKYTTAVGAAGGSVVDPESAAPDYIVAGEGRGGKPPAAVAQFARKHPSAEVIDEAALCRLLLPSPDELAALLRSGPQGHTFWEDFRTFTFRGKTTVSLAGVDLRGADIGAAKLIDVSLDGADLRKASAQYTEFPALKDAKLDGADLTNAYFQNAERCGFRKAAMSEAWFDFGNGDTYRDCDFTGANLAQSRGENCSFLGCVFDAADLSDSEVEKSDFSGVSLARADLTRAHLAGAKLGGAKLAGAILYRADLRDASLRDADLTGADLREVVLSGADLTGAKVDGANLAGAGLSGAKTAGVDFSRAKNYQAPIARVAGPKLRELAQAAGGSKQFVTKAVVELGKGEHATLTLSSNMRGNRSYPQARSDYRRDDNEAIDLLAAPTFEQGILNLAERWPQATLRLDTVQARGSRTVRGKKLLDLATAAWAEAFALEATAPADLQQQKAAQQAGVEKLRQAMLKELHGGAAGVKKWNARSEHERRQIGPLRGLDLRGANLAKVRLHNTDLQGCHFENANLTGANLGSCQLQAANFTGANLAGAWLGHIGCEGTSFEGAKLAGCDVSIAVLTKSNFRGADLTGADLHFSHLGGSDLTGARLEGVNFKGTTYDADTKFPRGFVPPESMERIAPPPALVSAAPGSMDFKTFFEQLGDKVDPTRLDNATKMLKAERFQLFADVTDEALVGVVRSQSSSARVYSCRLTADGTFGCCTQNLRACGGLHGALCKHLLVLVVGLTRAGRLDPATVDAWVNASTKKKPVLDAEAMSETFLRYKGAEAGEVDWRPTETIPEDYYAL